MRGEYPEGMFGFVTGVLRWATRVSAFLYSLTDRYPPFSLRADPGYPVDVLVERPPRSSRVYAAFTVIVQVAATVGALWLVVWLLSLPDSALAPGSAAGGGRSRLDVLQSLPQPGGGGLLLRQVAALPHLIVVGLLGLAAFFIWVGVQWVILFTGRYPRGVFDFVVGIARWQVRVNAYGLGLIDRYPPFTFDASLAVAPGPDGPAAGGVAAGATLAAASATVAAPAAATPGAWYPDPTGRHELRYWDGREWTGHVADGGVTGTDPLVDSTSGAG